MKILSVHCDYINFKPLKKALKEPEELNDKRINIVEIKDPLVIFTAVEKQDEKNPDIIKQYVSEIEKLAEQVNAKNVVLYPYAHLSPSLSKPVFAQKVLEEADKLLSKKFKVSRAPFGYYKQFELKCKGHPLSELSREINLDTDVEVKTGKSESSEDISKEEHKKLLDKMTKVKMSTQKAPKGKKSNIELGRDLDLYIVSEIVGGGLPLLTPKGTTIKREIERFITDEEIKRGYLYTSTPVMAKSDLYKVSGHWQHYKDSMFIFKIGEDDYALRPMTCPFQFILYKRKQRSYSDLPLKYAEIATLFRNEQSGELRGLTRVRQFNLADAHIICRPDQLEKEFEQVMDLLNLVMDKLKIKDIWYRFSKHDKNKKGKYIDNPRGWKYSEASMKKILDKLKVKFIEAKDEAAFYGPKLDLQYKDVYGKEDTLITVQIDFALPERYDLTYRDKDNKLKRPMIIHRSSTGATERMISYILEKTQGNLPLWLAPVQVRVINFTDKNNKSCENLLEDLKTKNIRADIDLSSEPLQGKIKQAEIEKIPNIVVIGNKEEENNTLAVRKDGKVSSVKRLEFIDNIIKEIHEKSS